MRWVSQLLLLGQCIMCAAGGSAKLAESVRVAERVVF
jgi:hypothetical protein